MCSSRSASRSSQLWAESRRGQHVELGIAENNLFLMLAALGMSGPLFGQRLIPVGTLYDPFIARGLDALTYASYQDALSPGRDAIGHFAGARGGAHQSVATPLIGIGQPELLSFEPPTPTSCGNPPLCLQLPAKRRWQLGLSGCRPGRSSSRNAR